MTITPAAQTIAQRSSASLAVSATDDGLPKRRSEGGEIGADRHDGRVGQVPRSGNRHLERAKAAGDRRQASATASFSEPGEYVLLAVVDDGSGESAGNFGYHCCWTNVQVKVTVTGAARSGTATSQK